MGYVYVCMYVCMYVTVCSCVMPGDIHVGGMARLCCEGVEECTCTPQRALLAVHVCSAILSGLMSNLEQCLGAR